MSQRHYAVLAGPTTVEVTSRVDLEGWELTEKAEEGAPGSGTLWLADPDMDFDIDGLRAYYVLEDSSEATDNVLFGGFVVDPELSHGEASGAHYDPIGRFWAIQLTDRNGYWNRRVMLGTDCKRPAETDVARIQWLFASTEAAWIDDDTTYVNTGSTSAMDKNPYTKQLLNQVVDDCAQHTGKNWWVQLQETGAGRQDVAWYGKDSVTAYTSPLYLTNDPAEMAPEELLDGTSLVWPISDDTKLKRDVSRVYTGVLINYAGGSKAVYRTNAASIAVYGRRDGIFDYPNIRTKAKAIARANRLLADLAEPNEIITTKVVLPAAKATKIRAGMRVQFKATHLEGYTSWQYLRVLSCTVKPVAAGTKYELALELQGSGATAGGGPPYTGSAFAGLLSLGRTAGTRGALDTPYKGDAGPTGWYAEPTVGAMWSFPTSGGNYSGITTSVAMHVRVEAIAYAGPSVVPGETGTLELKVNGAIVASDTKTGLGIWNFSIDTELDLAAGDTVSLSVSGSGGCFIEYYPTSPQNNYLRVGRGTHVWNSGAVTWVGP